MSHLISLLCCDVCPLPFFYSRLVPSPPFFFCYFLFFVCIHPDFPSAPLFFPLLHLSPFFSTLSSPLHLSSPFHISSPLLLFCHLYLHSSRHPLLFISSVFLPPLLSSLPPPLSSGLWDTRDSSIQPGTLWRIVRGQTLLCSVLGPPPNQRPGNGGVPCVAQTNALQLVPQTWQWSWICRVEPPRSHPTRLPQAESVCSCGSWLWGWPEQQVGEAEHLGLAGCDSPFRAGYRTPAGTWHKARRYCCWSQLVNYCRWSKKRSSLNISTVSLSACLVQLIPLSSSYVSLSLFLLFPSLSLSFLLFFSLTYNPQWKAFSSFNHQTQVTCST